MLPASKTTKIVAQGQGPVAQRAAVALGPDVALYISRLELAMDAQNGAVTVDNDLRVEQSMSVCDTFRDAEIDSNTGTAARILNRTNVLSVGFDYDALLSVFS
jgi:hypothetical protein